MDRDDLIDLFSEFGPITLRRMFSGYGITAEGVNFAMALRDGIIFRVDDLTVARFEAEGALPFQYQTKARTVVVKSYRRLPERLYDDPEELADWARDAVGAAHRAAAKKAKPGRARKSPDGKKAPVRSSTLKKSAGKKAAKKKTAKKVARSRN